MTDVQNLEVQITEIQIGSGIEATKGTLVLIHFDGRLEDGTQFDSTAQHGRPYQFVVGSSKVIKGMSLAVKGMKVGGKRKVLIPAALAYGERQIGEKIPAHSNLLFEIELLEARPRE